MQKDPVIKAVIQKAKNLNKYISRNSLIALYILCEYASDTSKWDFYFNTLPEDVSHHLLTFSDTDLLNFKDSPIMKQNVLTNTLGLQSASKFLNYYQLYDKYQKDYNTLKMCLSEMHPIFKN